MFVGDSDDEELALVPYSKQEFLCNSFLVL